MSFLKRLAPLCGALFLVALPIHSAPLLPGAVNVTTGTTFAADPDLGGLVLNDGLLDFRMDPTPATPLTDVGGRVQNRVLRSALTNVMIFMPRIRDTFNIDGGIFGITAFRLTGFAGWDVDVDFRTDGVGDKGFTSVSRSVDGDLMTFRYDDPLFVHAIAPGPQEESLFPSIKTNATNYAMTGTMEILGQLFDNSTGLPTAVGPVVTTRLVGIAAPVAPVPLPAGAVLILSALAGLAGLRRFKTY